MNTETTQSEQGFWRSIDWLDIKFSVCLALFYAPMKAVELLYNNPGGIGGSIGDIMTVLCIAYILWRAQYEPNKLREWGLTTPLTAKALVFATGLFALAFAVVVMECFAYGGTLSFDISYIFRMTDYVAGAFPQQFVLCGIVVVSLEKAPILRGALRIPLLCGLLFFSAHLWAIAHDPSLFSLHSLLLILCGILVTAYFLRFRTLIPVVALHAIYFVLGMNWVEKYL